MPGDDTPPANNATLTTSRARSIERGFGFCAAVAVMAFGNGVIALPIDLAVYAGDTLVFTWAAVIGLAYGAIVGVLEARLIFSIESGLKRWAGFTALAFALSALINARRASEFEPDLGWAIIQWLVITLTTVAVVQWLTLRNALSRSWRWPMVWAAVGLALSAVCALLQIMLDNPAAAFAVSAVAAALVCIWLSERVAGRVLDTRSLSARSQVGGAAACCVALAFAWLVPPVTAPIAWSAYLNSHDAQVPGALAGIDDVIDIAANGASAYALVEGGAILDLRSGAPLSQFADAARVAIGFKKLLVVTRTGTVWELPDSPGATPSQVTGLPLVRDVATDTDAGVTVNVALGRDGTVWVWGDIALPAPASATNGCGDRSRPPARVEREVVSSPRELPELNGATAVDVLNTTLVVHKADGTLWFWYAHDGCPARLVPSSTFDEVVQPTMEFLGADRSFAVDATGRVWALGSNIDGQLGVRSMDTCIEDEYESWSWRYPCAMEPVEVPRVDRVTALALGDGFTLALRSDGSVWMWGRTLPSF